MNNVDLAKIKERQQALEAFQKLVLETFQENEHFYIANNPWTGHERRVMKKGGAEWVAQLLGWRVELSEPETINTRSDKSPEGAQLLVHARVLDSEGVCMGQGAGARILAQDHHNMNTSVKMANKSAYVDAVIRAAGLSALFGQDHIDQEDRKDEPVYNKEQSTAVAEDQPADQGQGKAKDAPQDKTEPTNNEVEAKRKIIIDDLYAMTEGNKADEAAKLMGYQTLHDLSLEELQQACEMIQTSNRFNEEQQEEEPELDHIDLV